jgi:hypothetical protein
MFVSYMSGYTLNHIALQDARIEAALKDGDIKDLKARVEELRARSLDRDTLGAALLQCYEKTTHHVDALEDIKWQMLMVLNTCPGRERPPRVPRP